jgi:hypothetical protein
MDNYLTARFINEFVYIIHGEKMPRIDNVKLTPELQKALATAIKETLAIGDCIEVEIKVTGIIYDLKAEGCVQDAE